MELRYFNETFSGWGCMGRNGIPEVPKGLTLAEALEKKRVVEENMMGVRGINEVVVRIEPMPSGNGLYRVRNTSSYWR